MTFDNNGVVDEKSSYINWKTTKIGGEYVPYEDIEQSPYLKKIIEPRDKFKIDYDGYTYSVKIYENGNRAVFRNKIENRPSGNLSSPGETRKLFYKSLGIQKGGNQVDQHAVPDNHVLNTISKFRLIKLEEFVAEQDWKIFRFHPIAIIRDEAYVILIRHSNHLIYTKDLDITGRKSIETNNDFINKEADVQKSNSIEGDTNE